MTHKEALEVLDYHARWRKDKSDKMTQTHPEQLTEALDVAIKLLKEEQMYCHCKKPRPNQKSPVFECMNCDKQMK